MSKKLPHTNHAELNFPLFAQKHGITVQHKSQWRMVEAQLGQIHALPHSWGRLRATDGVLCYIELGDGKLFLGHIASFVKDKTEPAEPRPTKAKKQKHSNDEIALARHELLAQLMA